MKNQRLILQVFSLLLISTAGFTGVDCYAAAILSDNEALDAEVGVLREEARTFSIIRQGIALSLAQCEGGGFCAPPVNREELERLISTLNVRIGNLSQRLEETGNEALTDILVNYAESRDAYTEQLDKLAEYVGDETEAGDDLGEDSFEIFQDADDPL